MIILGLIIMDNESVNRIKELTNGILAKKFFTEDALTSEQRELINRIMLEKTEKGKISENIEEELESTINNLINEKKTTGTENRESAKTYDEKKLLFKLNNDVRGFTCKKCSRTVIREFNYCPFCGNRVELQNLTLYADGVNLDKGYVTFDELEHLKLVTPEEMKLLDEGKVALDEVGITVTQKNCPLEIKKELLFRNKALQEDKTRREELYNEKLKVFSQQTGIFKLSSFNDRKAKEKKFPVDKSKIPRNESDKDRGDITSKKYRRHILKVKTRQERVSQLKPAGSEGIGMEYAGVMYLLEAINNPKSPKLSRGILSNLNVSSNRRVADFLRKNGYVDDVEGSKMIPYNLKGKKVTDLKRILSENRLPVSGTKDELIKRICENVQSDKLGEYSKGKALLVTQKGKEFIDSHPQVEAYAKYLKQFKMEGYEEFYQKNKTIDLTEMLLKYLKRIREEYAEKFQWHQISVTYQTESRIHHDRRDYENVLISLIKYFTYTINLWSDNSLLTSYVNPITKTLQNEIIKAVENTNRSTGDIHELFKKALDDMEVPVLFMEDEEIYEYFIRVSGNDSIEKINKELESRFDTRKLEGTKVTFSTTEELEEVFVKVRKLLK